MNELDVLIPEAKTIKVGDEDVEIKLIKVGKVKAVVAAITPFAYLLPKPGQKPANKPIDFVSLVLNHTDDVILLSSLLSDKDKEWVENLEIDELVNLLSAIVERNLDFFIQRVLPSVSKATAGLIRAFYEVAANKNGHSPSSDSSQPATDSQT